MIWFPKIEIKRDADRLWVFYAPRRLVTVKSGGIKQPVYYNRIEKTLKIFGRTFSFGGKRG